MSPNSCIPSIIILLMSFTGIYAQYTKRQVQAPAPVYADLVESYPEVKAKAKETADALVRGDFDTVANYTYPKVIRLLGGRASMISTTEKEMGNIKSRGFTVKSVSVGEPNKFEIIGRQVFSIVPTTLTMGVPDGATMLVESFLVAVSEDNGKTWTFVDGTIAADRRMLRQIFPSAANRLKFPPKKRPVIYRNDQKSG